MGRSDSIWSERDGTKVVTCGTEGRLSCSRLKASGAIKPWLLGLSGNVDAAFTILIRLNCAHGVQNRLDCRAFLGRPLRSAGGTSPLGLKERA